ncbi:unnamed protein product [Schistosoma mattheei]|uniref:Uncharacterized protein n=1 Tax=Schistosoma mattheei TaxID=31246 RepID=A0A183PB80_9TREM|nr:unnamed protein product [Schistosoma mattheei]
MLSTAFPLVTLSGGMAEHRQPGKSQLKSADESGIRSLDNSQEDVFENNSCCKSVLTNTKSHLWFEEIIRRLSCVMETNRNELMSIMGSSDTDSSTSSLPNDFSIDMGTAAYTNSIALENWHNCLKNSTGKLVSHVAITCLDALSKWPNNIGHQSKVCERKRLPSSLLSITISHLENFQHCCIPKTAELLLDHIFYKLCTFYRLSSVLGLKLNSKSSFPDAKLLATMNSLLKGWINSVSSNANDLKPFEKTYSPNVISSHGGDKNNLQNISLPPLTTPLRDTNNLHKKVYGHSLSKAFTPDDNSFTEYHPISPIVNCLRFDVRASDPGHNCENVSLFY